MGDAQFRLTQHAQTLHIIAIPKACADSRHSIDGHNPMRARAEKSPANLHGHKNDVRLSCVAVGRGENLAVEVAIFVEELLKREPIERRRSLTIGLLVRARSCRPHL